MRLRPLTEAECYARCYGGVRSEQVSVVRPAPRYVRRLRERTEKRAEEKEEAA